MLHAHVVKALVAFLVALMQDGSEHGFAGSDGKLEREA
jgi:hypothetical protein